MHKLDTRVGPTLRRQMDFYNPRECASECGINFWTFYDLIENGAVEKPLRRLAKSFFYNRKDIEKIKQQLKKGSE